VPNHLYDLLDALRTRSVDLSSLQRLLYGGSAITPDRLREALAVFGPIVTGMYGMQEVGGAITVLSSRDHSADRPDVLRSSGRFVPGIVTRLVDATGHDVAPGDAGEIILKSPTATPGYWRQEEQTAELVRGGWLRTGDLATVDDQGYVTIVGRSKDMIVSGGFNVFPIEVENALCSHDAVRSAAAFGVPHEKWGEAVHAVVELHPGASVSGAELIALVKELKGSVYAPKSLEFAKLPRTSAGKVDKAALCAARNDQLLGIQS
jgi:acyl-CoA synthetase (AMP-forming)/AMP-acid ligase II